MKSNMGGLSKKGREQLSQVLKISIQGVEVHEVARLLKITPQKATQLLSGWCKRGWLSRVRRGLYIPIPLQASNPNVMVDDPWGIAQKLFSPCYIGGWSAAVHWNFTEQIFSTTLVISSKKTHEREHEMNGVKFRLKTVKRNRLFGAEKIWRDGYKVEVSDPTKTIVDCMNDPSIAGGVRMTIDFFVAYMKSKDKNLDLLVIYAEKMGNSAIFKRMGFILSSNFPTEKKVIKICKGRIRSGLSSLDPSVKGGELSTNWNLWVPKGWKKGIPV